MEFSNHLVQTQWRLATLKQLEELVRGEGAAVDVKHPLLTSLLTGLQSASTYTTLTCSTTLTAAATRKWVEPSQLISALVSTCVTATHPQYAIHTIAKVLLWQAACIHDNQAETFRSPYSLRSSVHPFISVYNISPQNGLCLADEVVSMLSRSDSLPTFIMLEPFIKYVLLHPTPSPQLSLVSHHLLNKLVGVVKGLLSTPKGGVAHERIHWRSALVRLLVQMVPLGVSKTSADLLSLVSMATQVIELTRITGESCDLMVDVSLSFFIELTSRGLPSLELLEALCTLTEEMEEPAFGSTARMLSLSWLLYKSLPCPESVNRLLKLCTHLSSKVTTFGLLLILPLVQILSLPTSCDLSSTNQKMAASVLTRIQEIPQTEVTPPQTTPTFSRVSSLAELYNLLCADSVKLVPFLKRFEEDCLKELSCHEPLCIVLCALAMRVVRGVTDVEGVGGVERVRTVLSTLMATAQHDSSLAPSLLPFIIHLLSLSPCPHTKLAILHSIPSLATHKIPTSSVQSTIRVIGGNPLLISMVTRLYGWTWEKQDHIFSSLLQYITQPLPQVAMETRNEIQLSRATLIRDVCVKRPELHGESVLSVINGFVGSHDSVVVAMAIESLVELCGREVVDVVTLWGVMEEILGKDTRPAVMVRLCSLFELASDHLETDKHSHKVFKMKALEYLCSCVLSGHPRVCSASLLSLSSFQMTDIPSSLLPGHLESHDRSHDELCDLSVTGSQLVNLFRIVPHNSFPELVRLLTAMLQQEAATIGRGVVSTALTQAQAPTQADKVLETLTPWLLQTSSKSQSGWVSTAAMLSLSEVKVHSTPTTGRQVTRQLLAEQVSLMEDALKVGVASSSDDLCERLVGLEAGKSWKKFMNGLLLVHTQVFLKEERLVSTEEVGVASETDWNAHHWTLHQVLEKLQQFAMSNPTSAGNVLLAVVGVVSSCISHLTGHPDHVMRINQSESLNLLLELLDVLTRLTSEENSAPTLSTTLTPLTPLTPLTAVLYGDTDQLKHSAWYSLPVLVEVCAVLHVQGCVGGALEEKLVRLASNLTNSFARSTAWYELEVTNQILVLLSPMLSEVGVAMSKMMGFIDYVHNNTGYRGLDILCQVSALLPTFSVSGRGSPSSSLEAVRTALTQTLSTVEPILLSSSEAKLCCVHLTLDLVIRYCSGGVSDQGAMTLVGLIADLATKTPQEGVYTLCLGAALHDLADKGHTQALSLCDTLAVRWLKELEEATQTVRQNLVTPLLWGLASLLGFFPGFRPIRIITGGHSGYIRMLCPLVVKMFKRVQSTFSEGGVASTTLWLLTQIQNHLSEYFSNLEKVPHDYCYLPLSSILPSLHTLLEGCHGDVESQYLAAAVLEIVCKCESGTPPCDWSRLIVPCLRSSLCQDGDEDIETKSVCCVQKLTGFSHLLSCCVRPLVLNRLKCESWRVLLDALPVLARSLSTSSLGTLLHTTLTSPHLLHASTPSHLLLPFLRGICKTLPATGLSPDKKRVLSVCVERAYNVLLNSSWPVYNQIISECLQGTEGSLWELARCLHQCGTEAGKLRNEFTLDGCYGAAMECYLVKEGLIKFTVIERVLEFVLQNTGDSRAVPSLLLLLRTIASCCSPHHSSSTLNQTDSLHMLLSWTRSHQVSSDQMLVVLLLAHSATAHSTLITSVTTLTPSQSGEWSGHLWGVLRTEWVEPRSPAVRKKLCECLVEWLGQSSSNAQLRNTFTDAFSKLKNCAEYQSPIVWTSVGHLL